MAAISGGREPCLADMDDLDIEPGERGDALERPVSRSSAASGNSLASQVPVRGRRRDGAVFLQGADRLADGLRG